MSSKQGVQKKHANRDASKRTDINPHQSTSQTPNADSIAKAALGGQRAHNAAAVPPSVMQNSAVSSPVVGGNMQARTGTDSSARPQSSTGPSNLPASAGRVADRPRIELPLRSSAQAGTDPTASQGLYEFFEGIPAYVEWLHRENPNHPNLQILINLRGTLEREPEYRACQATAIAVLPDTLIQEDDLQEDDLQEDDQLELASSIRREQKSLRSRIFKNDELVREHCLDVNGSDVSQIIKDSARALEEASHETVLKEDKVRRLMYRLPRNMDDDDESLINAETRRKMELAESFVGDDTISDGTNSAAVEHPENDPDPVFRAAAVMQWVQNVSDQASGMEPVSGYPRGRESMNQELSDDQGDEGRQPPAESAGHSGTWPRGSVPVGDHKRLRSDPFSDASSKASGQKDYAKHKRR